VPILLGSYERASLQIELKAEDLYDKEKVDLETIVIDDVFKLLQCTEEGLNQEEAHRRLELFGPNKLESEEQNPFLQVSLLVSLGARF
jgi:H+-transporting ATPase